MPQFYSLLWSLVILGLMWMPTKSRSITYFHQMDLVMHAGLFVILGLLLERSYEDASKRWIFALLFGFLLSCLAEGGQLALETRSFDLMDLMMNITGMSFGLMLKQESHKLCYYDAWVAGFYLIGSSVVMTQFDEFLFQMVTDPVRIRILLWMNSYLAFLSLIPFLYVIYRIKNTYSWIFLTIVEGLMFKCLLQTNPIISITGFVSITLLYFLIITEFHHPTGHSILHFVVVPFLLTWFIGVYRGPSDFLLESGSLIVSCILVVGLFHRIMNVVTPP